MVPSLEGITRFQFAFVVGDLERAAREFDGCSPPGHGAVESAAQTTAEMEGAGPPVIASIHSFGAAGDGAAVSFDTAGVPRLPRRGRRVAGPDAAAGLHAVMRPAHAH